MHTLMSNNATLADRQEAIVEEFSAFDDWMGRYEYLIELGKSLPPLDEKYKTEENKIHGCQSQVWVHARYEDGRVFFDADSDALITKGLAALLVRVLSGLTPHEIATAELSFINRIGLREHLSPTRKNGLNGMILQMKRFALEHSQAVKN